MYIYTGMTYMNDSRPQKQMFFPANTDLNSKKRLAKLMNEYHNKHPDSPLYIPVSYPLPMTYS